jgi:hypothetical protein
MALLKRTLLPALLLGLPLVAPGGDRAEDLAPNHRDLARLQDHPSEYARLRDDARAFVSLPASQQAQLLKLDADLHAQDSATQARLRDVLARYANWLKRLPEKDRRRIQEAASGRERLKRIQEIRQRQRIESLPRAQRVELKGIAERTRAARLAVFRQQQRQFREDWHVALNAREALLAPIRHPNYPLPVSLTDLSDAEQTFVREYLRPRLTAEEAARLDKAQEQWPLFPRTLVELADRYPLALPGPRGPKNFTELPTEVRRRFIRKVERDGKNKFEPQPFVRALTPRWPDFASQLVEALNSKKFKASRRPLSVYELWPSRERDLSATTHEFLLKKLLPVLDKDEKELLRKAEGHWPAYPSTIQALAARHYLSVPWQTLPGGRKRWDGYRLRPAAAAEGLPPVARAELQDFEQMFLRPREREDLKLSHDDPLRWLRLTRAYFAHKPEELRRLQQIDRQKGPRLGE